MPFPPDYLRYADVRKQAEAFSAEYHSSGLIPVPIDEIVEFDLSMRVVPVDGLKQHLGVDAWLTHDLENIFMDEWVMLHAKQRYRFSLAHEVGHWWMHDELYAGTTITSVAGATAVMASIPEEEYRRFEFQANAFAGIVLVPTDPLRHAFLTAKATAAKHGVHDLDAYPAREFVTQNLAHEFDVSDQVMTIRLEKEGHLTALRIAD